jgi:hypothetical protein
VNTSILKTAAIALFTLTSAFPQAKPVAGEVDSFRLSLPRINATVSAYTSLIDLLASDPGLAAKFKDTSKSLPDTNGRDTISLAAAKMQAIDPRVGSVFTKAGITAKEAGMTMECLIGVMLGDGMLQGAKAEEKNLPAYVAENLAFYRANKPAVEAALAKLQSASAKAAKSLGKDEDDQEEKEEKEDK